MDLYRNIVFWSRGWGVPLMVLAATGTLRADQIQFSKPAIEIAAPTKAEEFLPQGQGERMEFVSPQVAPSFVPPQPAIIMRPMRNEEEDERFPFQMPIRSGERSRETSFLKKDSQDSREILQSDHLRHPLSAREPFALEDSETERALAPMTDFNWDGRGTTKNPNSPRFGGVAPGARTGQGDDKERVISAFSLRREEDMDHENGFKAGRFSGAFGRPANEKTSPEILDRRAAFEQLLNPGAGVAGRTPGSLEPVPSLDPNTLIPGLPMPTIGRSRTEKSLSDPMQAFNVQQDRLRGPVLEDVNKKYVKPAASTVSSTVDTRFQTPLNRQPTTREFPTRKF